MKVEDKTNGTNYYYGYLVIKIEGMKLWMN
jgi:hypothetical protein